jgi:hypothetical protein
MSLAYPAIVIIVGVLATTLSQSSLLAKIPLQNLLKNELHVGRAANAAFFFWEGFPWYFKPIVGILTDAFPIFGTRRKSLLWTCVLIEIFMVVASTAVGGYMVEIAQAMSASGRLTALRNFVMEACYIISGPASGFLASIAFGWTAISCGAVMALLIPATIFFLKERRRTINRAKPLDDARTRFLTIIRARSMWAAAGLMALFYSAPGLTTAVFYLQQNELHMDTRGQGLLQMIGGIGGVVAAIGYGFFCRHIKLRTLLVSCLVLGTAADLGYLFYSSVANARIIEAFGSNGFGYTLAELALMDLAVRATPAGSEALGFSLMMSVRNFALYGTDWLGSAMLETYHLHFHTLVMLNALTTAITVPLIFALPVSLVRKKEGELIEEAPAPKSALQ